MEYTIQKLSKLAGISTRTLRYYDQINLLKPARINSSGYRIYGENEVNKLQHILFFKELELGLEDIRKILNSSKFKEIDTLKEHYEKLLNKRKQLDILISNVEKTIEMKEGKITMSDKEKFEGFKQNMIDENEEKYGEEIREKYREEDIDKSYNKIKNMTKEQYEVVTKLAEEIIQKLNIAFEQGDPASKLAQEVADLHKKWLTFYWDSYSKEAHIGVANMYVQDERFAKYYETKHKGAAEFLRDAIVIYNS